MSFIEVDEHKFELTNVRTWGVAKDRRYDRISIPIVPTDDVVNKIGEIAKSHGAKNPVRKNGTLYLKCKSLTEKQTKELLNACRCRVDVTFSAKGLFTKSDNNYLVFKVNRLSKSAEPDSDSDCPED